MLSIIIPTYNEIQLGILKDILFRLSSVSGIEIICVDRESRDGTQEVILAESAQLIETRANTRAERINIGIKNANGNIILLHHPRSLLEIEGIHFLKNLDEKKVTWGGFTHRFDQQDHPFFKFTSWYSNHIRFDKRGIVFLDHCIFFRRDFLKKEEEIVVPELDIFEDTAFSAKLRKKSFPQRLHYFSTTSSYRFQKNGIIRQSFINQMLKVGYHFNYPVQKMNKVYENNLDLNSKY